jgi:hypothetical protein
VKSSVLASCGKILLREYTLFASKNVTLNHCAKLWKSRDIESFLPVPKIVRQKICDAVRVDISTAILVQQFNRKGGEASLCRPEASAGALALVA